MVASLRQRLCRLASEIKRSGFEASVSNALRRRRCRASRPMASLAACPRKRCCAGAGPTASRARGRSRPAWDQVTAEEDRQRAVPGEHDLIEARGIGIGGDDEVVALRQTSEIEYVSQAPFAGGFSSRRSDGSERSGSRTRCGLLRGVRLGVRSRDAGRQCDGRAGERARPAPSRLCLVCLRNTPRLSPPALGDRAAPYRGRCGGPMAKGPQTGPGLVGLWHRHGDRLPRTGVIVDRCTRRRRSHLREVTPRGTRRIGSFRS